jgi:hypothetical protein
MNYLPSPSRENVEEGRKKRKEKIELKKKKTPTHRTKVHYVVIIIDDTVRPLF